MPFRDIARQQLKNLVSTKISNSSTGPGELLTNDARMPPVVLLQSTLFGGTGGGYFDDYNENIVGIAGMRIRAGELVDSIQVTYQLKDGINFTAPIRGGTGGSEYSFTLSDDEVLTRMEVMTNGELVDRLTFYSNMNNVYGPYGGITGQIQLSMEAVELMAFFGHFGRVIDGIGVYYTN